MSEKWLRVEECDQWPPNRHRRPRCATRSSLATATKTRVDGEIQRATQGNSTDPPSRDLERREDRVGSELARGNRCGHCKSPCSTIAGKCRFLRVGVHSKRRASQDPEEASGARPVSVLGAIKACRVSEELPCQYP